MGGWYLFSPDCTCVFLPFSLNSNRRKDFDVFQGYTVLPRNRYLCHSLDNYTGGGFDCSTRRSALYPAIQAEKIGINDIHVRFPAGMHNLYFRRKFNKGFAGIATGGVYRIHQLFYEELCVHFFYQGFNQIRSVGGNGCRNRYDSGLLHFTSLSSTRTTFTSIR